MLALEGSTLTLSLVGVTTALVLYCLLRNKASRYPPVPLAFPVVGNLPQLVLVGSLTAFANHYRKKYGDVFTFFSGKNVRIVISGYDVMRELLVKNANWTSNRSTRILPLNTQKIAETTPGLFWAPFPHWKTLRSFAINSLREKGMGKASLEPKIQKEIEHYLTAFIEPNLNKPIRLKHGISQATCNIVSQMMYGKRREYTDERFNQMISTIQESLANNIKVMIVSSLPSLIGKWLAKSLMDDDKARLEDVELATMKSYIDEHKIGLDRENPRDVTDRFLIHSEVEDKEPCFSEENCAVFELHLYLAGTDTTATALTWALLFMCLHPEKQLRVQQEIDREIGRDEPASCRDRVDLPYTDAVLFETLRKGNIVPTSLPHTLEKDVVIGRTLIPAGADLMLNMSSVLYDEKVLEEPEKFKPERYLTGGIALKKQRTIPFGLGRRACLGENLAKMELFLFFTTFLQKYKVHLPEGSTTSDESVESVIRSPKPYYIVFTRR